jgi:hypothetical protein
LILPLRRPCGSLAAAPVSLVSGPSGAAVDDWRRGCGSHLLGGAKGQAAFRVAL